MKLLDRYIIRTFFGPFLFIFSVLFFIFMVNVIWVQMSQIFGKGLTVFQIAKLFFYLSPSVVSLVLPLTILLSSIMTFGDLGERYELAAIKAAGISLLRIMQPLAVPVVVLSVILFFFQNNVTPDFQRKSRNMLANIDVMDFVQNFTPGYFVQKQMPGYSVKFDKISGEKPNQSIEGIFIHKSADYYNDQQAIVAKRGRFVPADDKNYLKLILFDGYIYEDNLKDQDYNQKLKQLNSSIKFDTLISNFDISALINKQIDQERITDDYRFQSYRQIDATILKKKKENDAVFSSMGNSAVSYSNGYAAGIDAKKMTKPAKPQFDLNKISRQKKLEALYTAYNKVEQLKSEQKTRNEQIFAVIKAHNKMIMYQQRIFSFSFTCIIFFMIGASLGSIIRKGGIGLPVVVAIVIFIIFYVMNLTVENFSWKGRLDPYLAAWLPNIILFPFGIWLTVKALTDSQVFDAEKYKAFFKPIISRFQKPKEHARYQ